MSEPSFGQRLPPQNLEAEQSVLGSMLLDKDAIYTAVEFLQEEDFYRTAHQRIFKAMIALSDRAEPVDLVTLAEELKKHQLLEKIGGTAFLVSLANAVPTAANVAYYAQIVREKAILRDLISSCTDIITSSYDSPASVDEFLDLAEQRIFEVGSRGKFQDFFPLKEVLVQAFERIERLYDHQKGVTGLSSGFSDLDEISSGLQESDLIIVAARPGMGKTTLALNIAHHIAVREKKPAALFSLEMSREQLAQRLLCSQAHIDSQSLRRGYLSQEDWQKLTRAVGPLSDAPLYIDDSASLSVMEIRSRARRLKAEKGLEVVFVDYLQLMRGHGRMENRQQELSDISRSLKALAKELCLPVIALSQLSRAVEKRPDRRPILSDLMESGGIEANADMVLFIYREAYYTRDTEKGNMAEIIVAKQRNGPTGTVELYFLDRYNKFVNIAREKETEATPPAAKLERSPSVPHD